MLQTLMDDFSTKKKNRAFPLNLWYNVTEGTLSFLVEEKERPGGGGAAEGFTIFFKKNS